MNRQDHTAGMTIIVKTITRATVGLVLLYGIHIVVHGDTSPGGGFAGGVIIALSYVHMTLAFGRDVAYKRLSQNRARQVAAFGALLFLGIALIGLTHGHFFENVLPQGAGYGLFSGGIIPFCNIAVGLKVGGGIILIFLALVALRPESETKP